MTKTFYSGDWYMVISNEPPVTNSRKTYCMFDLTKYKGSLYGCPINQFGSMEDVLDCLIRYREISNRPEYDCIRDVYKDRNNARDYFISVLREEIKQKDI